MLEHLEIIENIPKIFLQKKGAKNFIFKSWIPWENKYCGTFINGLGKINLIFC